MNTGEPLTPALGLAGRGAASSSNAFRDGCPACGASGLDRQDPDECCTLCEGTGKYTGIPDAWGEYGVDAVYLDTDGEPDSETGQPRALVRINTFSCDTTLTLDGAEELTRRVFRVVDSVRHQAKERAARDALAAGERSLELVRDELGPRAYNCLARGGVLTIEQAARMSDKELLAIVNLGVAALERIRTVTGRDEPAPENAARP